METKTKKNDNKIDAIKIMREIRDKLSFEIKDMNYEQERAYLDKILSQGQNQQVK